MDDFEETLVEATKVLQNRPLVRELHGSAIVSGDIHGDIDALNKIIRLGEEHKTDNILLLGDYVDRGEYQLEVVHTLAQQIIENEDFVPLRGNHEDINVCSRYGFSTIVDTAGYDFGIVAKFFAHLPIAAVSDDIFGMHGGLPVHPDIPICEEEKIQQIPNGKGFKIEQLTKIERSPIIYNQFVNQLLWNDPISLSRDINQIKCSSPRGPNFFTFGKPVTEQFLESHNLNLILRAHIMLDDGYRWFHDQMILSLFSTSAGPYVNVERKVAKLDLDDANSIEIYQL